MLGPTAHDLAGEWHKTTNDYLFKCIYVSKTVVACKMCNTNRICSKYGYKLNLNGEKVTSESDGKTCTLIQHGSNYDTIFCDDGTSPSVWKKQGMYDNINTFTFFTISRHTINLMTIILYMIYYTSKITPLYFSINVVYDDDCLDLENWTSTNCRLIFFLLTNLDSNPTLNYS